MSTLRLRVSPGAKQSGWKGALPDGRMKVAIAAPPLDGRANEALVRFVAKALGVKAGAVRVAHGAGGRDKVVEVDLDPEELSRRLVRATSGEAE